MRAYAGRGNTVLFSTHYLEEADDNADRIVVVDRAGSSPTTAATASSARPAAASSPSTST